MFLVHMARTPQLTKNNSTSVSYNKWALIAKHWDSFLFIYAAFLSFNSFAKPNYIHWKLWLNKKWLTLFLSFTYSIVCHFLFLRTPKLRSCWLTSTSYIVPAAWVSFFLYLLSIWMYPTSLPLLQYTCRLGVSGPQYTLGTLLLQGLLKV